MSQLTEAYMKSKLDGWFYQLDHETYKFRWVPDSIASRSKRVHTTGWQPSEKAKAPVAPPMPATVFEQVLTLLEFEPQASAPIDMIIRASADVCGVFVTQILSDSLTREVCLARHLAIHLVRKNTNLSLPAIGKVFRRDHTSVLNSIKRVSKAHETFAPLINRAVNLLETWTISNQSRGRG